jgi:hypothetical protein
MFTRWLSSLPHGRSRRNAPRHSRQWVARLAVEALEDRYVPSTLTVTSALDDSSTGTLRDVVNTASAGDVINFDPSLNGQTITLTQGEINIAKDLTIQGPGASLLTISGNNASRIFNVDATSGINVTLSDLTLTAGNGADTTTTGGGAIRSNNANLTLERLTVSANHAAGAAGGGILDQAGTLTVQDSTINNNTAGTTGGGISLGAGGVLTLVNTTVQDNTAGTAGGGVAASPPPPASTSGGTTGTGTGTGTGGSTSTGTTSSQLTIRDSTISHNTAGTAGGGLSLGTDGASTVINTTLSDNTASTDGGGIADDTSALTLQLDTISNNTAGGQGGGVRITAPADSGGSILVDTTTISNNTAAGDGGGLFTGSASPAGFTIQGSTITSNKTTAGSGGGLALVLNTTGGPVNILTSTVANNSAATQGGGGILLDGTASNAPVLIGYSTMAGNQAGNAAGDNGGGLLISNAGGTVSLLDSTLTGNSTAGSGGGLFDHHSNGSFLLLNSTINNNSAAISGGGLQVDTGATLTQLESTIIAGNATGTIGPDVVNAGSIVAANNNLIQNGFAGTAPTAQVGNLFGQDPLLGPLQDNGGATPTEAPLIGSPVIDKGSNPANLATDQRGAGFNRTIGTQPDIGAVEINPNAPSASLVSAPSVDASSPPNTYAFQVSFDDQRGIHVNSLGAAVRVTGPNGFSQVATLTQLDGTTDDPHRVATYSVTPPGGMWTLDADGTYTISIEPDTARNVDGDPVPPGPLGTFTVDLTNPGTGATSGPKHFYAVGADTFVPAQERILHPSNSAETGGDVFHPPQVRVYDAATGAMVWEFNAYPFLRANGVRVAVADINGDGVPDIITAPGPPAGPGGLSIPLVEIWSGATHGLMAEFLAYPGFTGGVYVATGDVNGDGVPDIITGTDAGAGPNVAVFSGKDLSPLYSFFAFDPVYTGGVRVAAADVNGDGKADIIVTAATVPQIRVFSGADGSMLANFMALVPGYLGGLSVAAADLDGDGHAEIIVGTMAGGHSQVEVFSGIGGLPRADFMAFGFNYNGAVHVGTADDLDGNGLPDILVGSSSPAGPHLRTFDGLSMAPLASFWALPRSLDGIFVS